MTQLLEGSAAKKEKRIGIDVSRPVFDLDSRTFDCKNALRCIVLEKKRIKSNNNRTKDAAEEKCVNYSIQPKMVRCFSKHIEKPALSNQGDLPKTRQKHVNF